MADIWEKEMPGRLPPDCNAIVEASDGNMRAAIMNLELELIIAKSQKPKLVAVSDQWGRTAYVPLFA